MKIGFVRHGKTDWNEAGRAQGQTDIPLNETGRNQAIALADRLSDDPPIWEAVVSSDLSRAHETAKVIADKLGIPLLEPDIRLRERYFGEIEGLTPQERVERYGENWRERDLGQESDRDLRDRGIKFLSDLQQNAPNGNILIVSHGGFLAQLYEELCPDLVKSHLDNVSYSILSSAEGKWEPLLYNCTRHLNDGQFGQSSQPL
ncbi:histidine phosphatase family protein [Paenibacillus sp. NPDC058071]|uniref:histidine phosphatase family protein n=1 Tax=Paenibacillus sp. NPDC058071 TaxID=3346326 RepID=UPI0036DBAB09